MRYSSCAQNNVLPQMHYTQQLGTPKFPQAHSKKSVDFRRHFRQTSFYVISAKVSDPGSFNSINMSFFKALKNETKYMYCENATRRVCLLELIQVHILALHLLTTSAYHSQGCIMHALLLHLQTGESMHRDRYNGTECAS